MRALRRRDQGQFAPILALLVVVVLAGGFTLFEIGRASTLRAGAQTAADAAALAAVEELAGGARSAIRGWAWGHYRHADAEARARGAAEDYARRNGAELTGWRFSVSSRELVQVQVRVRTDDALTGRTARSLGVEGTRADAEARARLHILLRPGVCPAWRCLEPPDPPEPPDDLEEGEEWEPPPPPPWPPNHDMDPDSIARFVARLVPMR